MRLLLAVQEFLKDSGYNGTRNWKDIAVSVVATFRSAPEHLVGLLPFERLHEAYKEEMEDARKLFDKPSQGASACTVELVFYNPSDLLMHLGIPKAKISGPLSMGERSILAWKPLESLANKRLSIVSLSRKGIRMNSLSCVFPFTSDNLMDTLRNIEEEQE